MRIKLPGVTGPEPLDIERRRLQARTFAKWLTGAPGLSTAHGPRGEYLGKTYNIAEHMSPETKALADRFRSYEEGGFNVLQPQREAIERMKANTGSVINIEDFLEQVSARRKLKEQSLFMVNRLLRLHRETSGSRGVDLRRPVADGKLYLVCSEEDRSEELPSIKHQVFIPLMAHDARLDLVRDFEFWMQKHEHTRYYVITTGTRCGVHEIKQRFNDLHEKISELRRKIRKIKALQKSGVEVVLRADEITIKREADGELSYHCHTNLAIHFPRFMTCRFDVWLRFLRMHFKARIQDGGQIENVRELIKYFVKYEKDTEDRTKNDLLRYHGDKSRHVAIEDIKPFEMDHLYQVRRGVKPVQCMGEFKLFRRRLTGNRLKVFRRRDEKSGDWRLVIEPRPRGRRRLDPEAKRAGAKQEVNLVIGITEPQPRFGPVLRPAILVKNFNGDYEALRRSDGLDRLKVLVGECCNTRALQRAERAKALPPAGSVYTLDTITETPEGTQGNFQSKDVVRWKDFVPV